MYSGTPSGDVNINQQVFVENQVFVQTTVLPVTETQPATMYTVETGDTLFSIAQKFKISLSQIKEWNKIGNEVIYVGQELIVRESVSFSTPDMPSSKEVEKHTVQAGETLYTIASKYGISVEQLRIWNQLNGDTIYTGQELLLTGTAVARTNNITIQPEAIVYESRGNNNNRHTVVKGDSLYAISKKYGVTVDQIKTWNQLKNNDLRVGQELIISQIQLPPEKPISPTVDYSAITHKVATGDTLLSISKKYGISIGQLKAWNQLTDDTIRFGQVLIVGQKNVAPPQEAAPPSPSGNHTVVKGDTLYGISKKYGVTVDQIKTWNRLQNNNLYIGQQLIVKQGSTQVPPAPPVKPEGNNSSIHTVVKGDNLYAISKKYGVTVDQIKMWNGLKNNDLSIGQQLIVRQGTTQVPPAPPVKPEGNNTSVHVVATGDNLYAISKKYGVTVDQIKTWNQLKNNIIHVGQKLIVKQESVPPAKPTPPTKPEGNTNQNQTTTHKVAQGETLYGISKKYGVSVDELRLWNQLKNDLIVINQLLVVNKTNVTPAPPTETPSKEVTHTVVKGETLYGISKKYGVSVAKIKEFNKLAKDVIFVGQVLKIK